jgi:hypothetical protein
MESEGFEKRKATCGPPQGTAPDFLPFKAANPRI